LNALHGAADQSRPAPASRSARGPASTSFALAALNDKEATSDYGRPPFYLFEAHGLQPWLVNAKDVKHLPGRPKTDVLDAVWLCKVAERQMLQPSFVPPADIRRLRDLTRYRVDLVGVRTAEKELGGEAPRGRPVD
jgi:transposase